MGRLAHVKKALDKATVASGAGAFMLGANPEAEAAFIGKGAGIFNTPALKKAIELSELGASRDEVWRATSEIGSPTFKDVDGHWKQEIDDSGYSFIQPERTDDTAAKIISDRLNKYSEMPEGIIQMEMELTGFTGTPEEFRSAIIKDLYNELYDIKKGSYFGKDVVDHPELSSAYPEIDYGKVIFKNQIGFDENIRGAYDSQTNDIIIKADNPENRSILSHERQHYIQEQEGFAKGGNVEMFDRDVALYQLEMDALGAKDIIESLGENATNNQILKAYKDFWDEDLDPSIIPYAKMNPRDLIQSRVDRHHKELKGLPQTVKKEDAYQRLSGEAEARNVQTRLDMSMAERIARPPWETLDVPEKDLIIRGNSGVMDSRTPERVNKFTQKRADRGSLKALDLIKRKAQYYLEPAATVATGLGAGVFGDISGGIAGAASLPFVGAEKAGQITQNIQDSIPAYIPQSEAGMQGINDLGNVINEQGGKIYKESVDYWGIDPVDNFNQSAEYLHKKGFNAPAAILKGLPNTI